MNIITKQEIRDNFKIGDRIYNTNKDQYPYVIGDWINAYSRYHGDSVTIVGEDGDDFEISSFDLIFYKKF